MVSLSSQLEFLDTRPEPADWQSELARSVRDPAELCRMVGLSSLAAEAAMQAADGFPILVPRPYLARIRTGDAGDPLLLQVLPRRAELDQTPGFTVRIHWAKLASLCGPGLLWKYQNRILILATQSCAVHCRFCFRRHFPFNNGPPIPIKVG